MSERTRSEKGGVKPSQALKQNDMVVQIPLSELFSFPNHPFKVRDDEAMQETTESIKQYGVLVPAIVRPREDGGYEIIAGHRRKHGSELAGLTTMPCIIREMDDATATILIDLYNSVICGLCLNKAVKKEICQKNLNRILKS